MNTNFKTLLSALTLFAGITCANTVAFAQDEKKQDDPPPSLDDLLGIDEEDRDDGATEAAEEAAKKALDEQLNEAELVDAFHQAARLMEVSAERLDVDFDSGLGTQRIQEDIIARLEQLIDQAASQMQQQQQQSSSSSSSSSSSQQQQQQQQNPGQRDRQNQQGEQQQQQGEQQNGSSSDPQEGMGPERQDGAINQIIDETRSEWGNLPERARDMLLQGRREKYSSLYERMTREYYRRLAEDNSGNDN